MRLTHHPLARFGVVLFTVGQIAGSGAGAGVPTAAAVDANRLTYLDASCDPFYPNHDFARLTTPQWVGEAGVDAVIVLSIDDMRSTPEFEAFLRPVLNRLKEIDGRAPVSVMANDVDPADPQISRWFAEGVSLETHTSDHPCPLLQNGDFDAAKRTYDRCVDHFFEVPNGRPVCFRVPCMDGINSPSPRVFAEIMRGTTPRGRFLTMSSSVAHVFTPDDPVLPRDLVTDRAGEARFPPYIPQLHQTRIENYPYPYVVGGAIWELPFTVPDDYEANLVHGPAAEQSLSDMKAALDLAVFKRGVYVLAFHPGAWMTNGQLVDLIDHAVRRHRGRIRFMTFPEIQERLDRNLLAGEPLRAKNGQANGVRLVDLNGDGHLDVIIGNERVRRTRIWDPAARRWVDTDFPTALSVADAAGNRRDTGVRFGMLNRGGDLEVCAMVRNGDVSGMWRFDGARWIAVENGLSGLELDGEAIMTSEGGVDGGVRMRDVDRDGECEIVVSRPGLSAVFDRDPSGAGWERAGYGLPDGVSVVTADGGDNGVRFVDVNRDGFDDVIQSNAVRYSLHLFVPEFFLGFQPGWSREVVSGLRGQMPEIPMIVRGGAHPDNGAWFARGSMWVQNEFTDGYPGLVRSLSFEELADGMQPPALSPAESMRQMEVAPGFTVELVASEPLVRDPVAFDWDRSGRMWVVEMGDYPDGIDGRPAGVVRILTDRNGDGSPDHASVFLEGVPFPNGVLCWRDGVLISAAPDILFARDTNGDGRADETKTLFSGFGEGNQQHRMNGFEFGLDHWVYGANGDSGGTIHAAGGGIGIDIGGRDFRFQPGTGRFEPASGQTQFGRRRDDWGNWFGNNNSHWAWHYVAPEHYLARNPRLAVTSTRQMMVADPEGGRVYPIGRKQQRMNEVGRAGFVTSANSPAPYRDVLFGEDYERAMFVSEPANNLIRCMILTPDGVSFSAERLDIGEREFLASQDPWFRPTFLKTGPDGALYVADMYRRFIEHTEWIPDDIEARFDVRDGDRMGRIYRVKRNGTIVRPRVDLDATTTEELAAALDTPSGWQRDLVQHILVSERRDQAAPFLVDLLRTNQSAKTRLASLCTLDGMRALTDRELVGALGDRHPMVRLHAIRVSEPRIANERPGGEGTDAPASISKALAAMVADPDLRVRRQLAFSLGESPEPWAADALAALAVQDGREPWMLTAITSSAATRPELVLEGLFRRSADEAALGGTGGLLNNLVSLIVAKKDASEVVGLIERIAGTRGGSHQAWQTAAFARLLSELERQNGSWSELRRDAGPEMERVFDAAKSLFEFSRRMAVDADRPMQQRSGAIQLLGLDPGTHEADIDLLASFLRPHQPGELQRDAMARLMRIDHPAVPAALMRELDGLDPDRRSQAIDVMMRRPDWAHGLMDRVESGALNPKSLGASARQRLVSHRDGSVRARAAKVLAHTMDTERGEVVKRALAGLESVDGTPGRGAELFALHCAVCHRFGDTGGGAGPDLAALIDRSAGSLVVALLDPNRAVEDKYVSYEAVTRDGEEHSGLLVEQTGNSITLVSVSGIEQTVLRSDLESLRASGRSLMPEGFEQLLTAQDLADLVAFIQQRGPRPKEFAGNRPATVVPGPDSDLELTPANAEIYGPGVVLESRYGNLGMWDSSDDRAIWTIQIDAPAEFEVHLEWACPGGSAGNRFEFRVGEQLLVAPVPATGSWDDYRQAVFGVIRLEPGVHRAVFRSHGVLDGFLIDLLSVRLVPVSG